MTQRHILGAALMLSGLALPMQAQDYWEYKDWRVSVSLVDTGEDLRKTCVAATGGDGSPVLRVSFSDGDAGPPIDWPWISVEEQAPRHMTTLIRDGDLLNLVFDDGDSAPAYAYLEIVEDVFEHAVGTVDARDSLRVLQAMQRNGQLDIVAPGGLLLEASLNGFSAAYLKLTEQCGISAEGVFD